MSLRLSFAATVVAALLLLLTWLLLRGMDPDEQVFDRALAALDDFAMVESAFHRDVLTARSGLLRNYDSLVGELAAVDRALDRLREVAGLDPELATAVNDLRLAVAQQEDLTERFKSDNALLQNSLSYFGSFSTGVSAAGQSSSLIPAVSALAAGMLHLMLDTSPPVAREVADRLDQLAGQPLQPGARAAIQGLLAHGRLLVYLLPETDGTLKALFDLPTKEGHDELRAMVVAHAKAAEDTARRFRLLLYAASLLLLGLLVHLGLRLRARAWVLQRRAAFEHVVADVSTRFINSRPHEIDGDVELALAQLAARVHADRAYFLVSGPPDRIYGWCRDGVAFPLDWPDHAIVLDPRFDTTAGLIHVPRVDRLPSGSGRDALLRAGVRSWACVLRAGTDGTGSVLGFDALRPGLFVRSDELGLLRMALDAIANAVGRGRLEREHARLESNLQQARRMETVGALASGIAHNFNNIVGAILGYTEMAEAQVAARSRAAQHLDEIRRAGERARDLIGKILAFGRRHDAQRMPVSLRMLIAEAVSLLRASLPSGIELEVREIPDGTIISGEAAQLQQVILNLCNNAAQAMNECGRIEIDAAVREISEMLPLSHGELKPGRYVRVTVSDNGHGMDDVTLGRIFEPFFSTRSAGNGLGLATIREIVREHGGALNVTSTPRIGSHFEAWLPCLTLLEVALSIGKPDLPLGRGETLLVVADAREGLLRGEEVLAALGYEPVGFTSVGDARAAYMAMPERFDAVVVGHVTPATEACPLAAALHRLAPALPIILATRSAGENTAGALADAGVAEVVRWPLVSDEIAAALKRRLRVTENSLVLLRQ